MPRDAPCSFGAHTHTDRVSLHTGKMLSSIALLATLRVVQVIAECAGQDAAVIVSKAVCK